MKILWSLHFVLIIMPVKSLSSVLSLQLVHWSLLSFSCNHGSRIHQHIQPMVPTEVVAAISCRVWLAVRIIVNIVWRNVEFTDLAGVWQRRFVVLSLVSICITWSLEVFSFILWHLAFTLRTLFSVISKWTPLQTCFSATNHTSCVGLITLLLTKE